MVSIISSSESLNARYLCAKPRSWLTGAGVFTLGVFLFTKIEEFHAKEAKGQAVLGQAISKPCSFGGHNQLDERSLARRSRFGAGAAIGKRAELGFRPWLAGDGWTPSGLGKR
jgi:hypothetical protein